MGGGRGKQTEGKSTEDGESNLNLRHQAGMESRLGNVGSEHEGGIFHVNLF